MFHFISNLTRLLLWEGGQFYRRFKQCVFKCLSILNSGSVSIIFLSALATDIWLMILSPTKRVAIMNTAGTLTGLSGSRKSQQSVNSPCRPVLHWPGWGLVQEPSCSLPVPRRAYLSAHKALPSSATPVRSQDLALLLWRQGSQSIHGSISAV